MLTYLIFAYFYSWFYDKTCQIKFSMCLNLFSPIAKIEELPKKH